MKIVFKVQLFFSSVSFLRDLLIFLSSTCIFFICKSPRDIVIQQLRQQIDDLTLICEEERLNHKMNFRKVI